MATESALRSKVANWLVPYIGLKEGDEKHKAIIKILNDSKLCTRYTMTVNDAWCATAVSAAFIDCGLTSIFPCVECSCAKMLTLASTAGIWVENDAYTPKVGDVVLYDWQDSGSGDNKGNPDHVGIVYSIEGTSMKIIEGNKSDTVGYRSLTVNGKYIRGYITPKYSSIATSETAKNTASGTFSVGDKVIVTGTIYGNGDGTGGSIKKTKATMYVVNIVDSDKYPNCIGLALKKGGTRQGWAKPSILTTATATSFSVGDKVIVTGTIYGNGDGTGGSIKKTKATMYVVNKADSSKYTNYLGLALKKDGTRQGWAKPSILTKA